MTKLKTQPCRACAGSGKLPADDVGPILREEREKSGITKQDMADALSISPVYLYDLERGNRKWTNELLASYQEKLEGLKQHVAR
jgi:transcriptional regulator with XRE-family HTH domain